MTANRWQIGVQYDPHRGNVNWSQPGGPNTAVLPAQENVPWNPPSNPIPPGNFFSEFSGIFFVGCQHSVMFPLIIREWDYTTNQSVALVCCPMCSFVQYTIEPYQEYTDPVAYPIVIV